MNLQFVASEIDRHVFQDGVAEGVQSDGQRLLAAMQRGDRATAERLRRKYERDAGRVQGGGGAGPGKVKTARRGTVTIYNIADNFVRSAQ